ncbi:MAG TPA: cytochrome P450 [Polyangiaceae bacterium]|nr:cytochrome P450 [Polyangiaceae bacterium]
MSRPDGVVGGPVTFPGYPPGPPAATQLLEQLRGLDDLRRDVLGTVGQRFATYGDFYYAEAPNVDMYSVCHPDLMHEVLVTQARAFRKRTTDLELLGNGLLTSDGEEWRRQRRRIQPGFRHDSIRRYATLIAEEAETLVQGLHEGSILDLRREMMQLTLGIVCRALFGQQFAGRQERLSRAMRVLQELVLQPKFLPRWLPTPGNLLRRHMIREVDREVFPIIDRGGEPGSLLADLIAMTDAEGAMTRQQLRDEVVTLFLAGHETTALTLTWTLYQLALHPEIDAELSDEVRRAPRDLAKAELSQLPLAERVLNESMRLYPPAYVIPRVCAEPIELGGYRLQPGAEVWLWVYFMHHDARWFDEPERFRPERFLPEAEAARRPNTFIPFGAGSRACVGQHFAMLEAILCLAAVLRRFKLTLVSPRTVRLHPRITLAPARPIQVRLEARR